MAANKRSQSRHLAVQALYQWQLSATKLQDIELQFIVDNEANEFDQEYFKALLYGVPDKLDEINAALKPALDRSIESVDPVERAIVRLATYELLYNLDVPYRVVINESVELAKLFGAEKGHKFVNGVVDKMARTIRKVEVDARRKK